MSSRLLLVLPALLVLGCPPEQNVGTHNAAPEATITSPSAGQAVMEGEAVTLRGIVSDADHDTASLLATWTAGSDEVCAAAAPDADGITTCEVSLELGQESIGLEVHDPQGAQGAATVEVIIAPTEAPEADILAPEADGTWYSDQKITFVGGVYEAEDDPQDLTAPTPRPRPRPGPRGGPASRRRWLGPGPAAFR